MSLAFDGTTGIVTGPNIGPTLFSFFMRIKPNSLGGGGFGRLAHNGDSTPNYWLTFLLDTSDRLRFIVHFTTTNGDWNSPSGSISFGTWQNVGVTYDGSVGVGADPVFYKDGAVLATVEAATPSGSRTGTGAGIYAANQPALDRGFDGLMAEWAMWFRILSAAEMAAVHHHGPLAAAGVPDIYWKLSGPDVNARDFSGFGRHGTVSGVASLAEEVAFTRPSVYAIPPLSNPVIPAGTEDSLALTEALQKKRLISVADTLVLGEELAFLRKPDRQKEWFGVWLVDIDWPDVTP